MKLTWLGTAVFVLESGKEKILFDPFMELQGGHVALTEDELLQYDTVFITHCHFDHFAFTADTIDDSDVTVFCTRQCVKTLERFEADQDRVVEIQPDRTYPIGDIRITPLRARHIVFRWRYILDTLSPWRMIRYAGNLPFLFWANRTFKEAGEIVAYDIRAEGREILLLGSLALDPEETYPKHPDVLILPYQGNNDLPARAREVLSVLQPKSVVLSHFDNAFPPMSRDVDLRPLKKLMQEEFPDIKVVKPEAFKTMTI